MKSQIGLQMCSALAKLFILHSWWQSEHNPMRLLPQFQHFHCNPFPLPPPASSDHTSHLRKLLTTYKYRVTASFNMMSSCPVVSSHPVQKSWRWWENILYSTPQSACCISILVCEAHSENISYAALSSPRPSLCLFALFISSQHS